MGDGPSSQQDGTTSQATAPVEKGRQTLNPQDIAPLRNPQHKMTALEYKTLAVLTALEQCLAQRVSQVKDICVRFDTA